MRTVAGITWGANEQDSVRGISETRPGVQLNSMVYNCKDQPTFLDKIQNQALRIITGAMKSTPITCMEQTTAMQPLLQRRHAKVPLQAEKHKCLADHPMKEKVKGRTKNRIKRSSFTHEVKKLQKD